MDMNVLTTSLTHLVGVLSNGQSTVQRLQGNVLRGLGIIEVTLAACWVALDASSMGSIFKKLLNLGFWIFFAQQFGALAHAFCQSLVQIGLGAGGSTGNFGLLLDPSAIAAKGLDVTEPLVKLLDTLGVTDLKDVFVFTLAYFVIMACYIVMSLQVFLAVIEFYLITTLAGALIPFGISSHTKFLAEKAIGAVVATSIKLMVLGFMLAVLGPTLSSIKFAGSEISLNELMAVILSSAAMAFLVWTAPSLAAGLLAGSPTLSAAGITRSVTSGAMMATGAAGGMLSAARGAGRAFAGGQERQHGDNQGPGSGGAAGGGRSLSRPRQAASILWTAAAAGARAARSSESGTASPPAWAADVSDAASK